MNSCASCSEVFQARAVLTDQASIDEYWKQLEELSEEGMLPDLQQQLRYYVYTIKGGGFCAHKSVVLSSNKTHFVTVELGLYKKGEDYHVYPVTRALAKENHSKLAYRGEVMQTGNQLINTALEVMKKFGNYNRMCRNCHDYCSMYMTAIGL